ncbi:MAG: ANTAR domain-containing protein [Actinobacteria bacterium]|nr:ANTAR domain-containing protein [Actinomycetota bacterium]
MTHTPARILVAEDETLIRMDLVEMLREAGYDVVGEATNGQEAIELAENLRPDIAILDVKMPVLDGISAAEKIIDIAPVLMLTAISRHTQMRSLAAEVADLHERLESRKLIDRAKGILMKALNLSEPEAFSWIQRAAMDRRITMKEVAEAVINPGSSLER